MSSILAQLGMQAGSGIVGAVGERLGRDAEKALGIDRKQEQLDQQRKLQELQNEGSKEMMNFGSSLQKSMWDYTNYENQRKHMEQAGLSPALMYGLSGGGGSTVGSVSAPTPSGGHASDEASLKSNSLVAQGLALQLAKLNSEIEVNKSIAAKNEAEKIKTSGVDTEKSRQETELLFQNTDIAKEEYWIKKIDADFAWRLKTAMIDNIVSSKDVNINKAENLKAGIELISSNMREIDQKIDNLKAQKNLTEEQIGLIKQQIAESMAKISLMSTQERENLANASETEMNNILLKDVTTHIGGTEMKVAGYAMPVITTILKSLLMKK